MENRSFFLVGTVEGSYKFFKYREHGWHFGDYVCVGDHAHKFLVVHDWKFFHSFLHHEFSCFFYTGCFADG